VTFINNFHKLLQRRREIKECEYRYCYQNSALAMTTCDWPVTGSIVLKFMFMHAAKLTHVCSGGKVKLTEDF